MNTSSQHITQDASQSRDAAVVVQQDMSSASVRRLLAVLRIGFGLTFLWAFFDKLLGLGYGTPSDGAWINGGSPTEGFLANAAIGPFEGFYHAIAGDAWADWLFMAGLLGIGLGLTLGVGMRIAGFAGALLYLMMWSVVLPPENNPVIDDHILGAITVVLLAVANAGDTWGLGGRWSRAEIVNKHPVLR